MSGLLGWILLLASETQFVESVLRPPQGDFEPQVMDVDGDGWQDLLVSAESAGERVLLWYRQEAGAFPSEPSWRMTLPDDVVSFAVRDVREEPGAEILLLTGRAVFSLSPGKPGLRGNIRREIELPLRPSVAASGPAACWPLDGGMTAAGRELTVLLEGALAVLEPRADGSGLQVRATLACPASVPAGNEQTVSIGSAGVSAQERRALPRFFPGQAMFRPLPGQPLLAVQREWRLPRWVDWNGDQRRDALLVEGENLQLYEQQANGEFTGPNILPAGLSEDDTLQLLDLDADGREEVVTIRKEEDGGDHVLRILRRAGEEDGVGQPSARLKLAALGAIFRFTDFDGDGLEDVVVWTFDVPRSLASLKAITVDLSLQVYRGESGARLGRRPVFRFERRLQPRDLERVAESMILDLSGDFDGDGTCDLLLLQPDGLLEIRRVVKDGRSWRDEAEPLARHRPGNLVRSVSVVDLGPDQVADLLLLHEDSMTVFSSVDGQP